MDTTLVFPKLKQQSFFGLDYIPHRSGRLQDESNYLSFENTFFIQNRRYLGNKYKLLGFIEEIVSAKCGVIESFCDIFAGTGVVGAHFNDKNVRIISNDLLFSNFIPLKTFLGVSDFNLFSIKNKIDLLNNLRSDEKNYFSENFGNTYFNIENARKIGTIREKINEIAANSTEKIILLTSLLYAVDKIANTVGHYDAYRKKMDNAKPIKLQIPYIKKADNHGNLIFREDANRLIEKVSCDVLYIDPPYNSRQYGDTYHLLENLLTWQKPTLFGKARKMDRSSLKSKYCLKSAVKAFEDLIKKANAKHILVSYNNTGGKKDERSNARIQDGEIMEILKEKGKVEIFEKKYEAFNAGKSEVKGHTERVFYCRIKK